jgi:hypothetical protein
MMTTQIQVRPCLSSDFLRTRNSKDQRSTIAIPVSFESSVLPAISVPEAAITFLRRNRKRTYGAEDVVTISMAPKLGVFLGCLHSLLRRRILQRPNTILTLPLDRLRNLICLRPRYRLHGT